MKVRVVEGPPLSGDEMGRALWWLWASRFETDAATWTTRAVCLWAEAIVDLGRHDIRRAVDSAWRGGVLLGLGCMAVAVGRFCRWQA